MRLIDADALVERTEILDDVFVVNWTTKKVQSLINAAPTIDAVPVVRCKDCTHRHSSEFCECRPEDAFCSDGERRSDG